MGLNVFKYVADILGTNGPQRYAGGLMSSDIWTNGPQRRTRDFLHWADIIIIIMEICKAPTLRLKALSKPSITHRHRDGKCYRQ